VSLTADIQIVIDALVKGEGCDDSGQCILVLNDIKSRLTAFEWIPCAQELPDDDITVLIHNEDWGGETAMGYMEGRVWLTTDGVSLDGMGNDGNPDTMFNPPTHWMHIPEPPQS
jgi:hypothetical protein